ncbi:DNA gyrase inhibitor [Gilliamella sp. wkB178]|nr:DNA gyrase inhibitor YacG [Gilliamella apicola]OCG07813.1 DNA gyrase inhibitor [Gilliamella apicola]
MNKHIVTMVKCPTCQTEIEWSEKSPYRPFCSKRCQLIDLGDWASEEHRIPDKDISVQDLWSEDELIDFVGRH